MVRKIHIRLMRILFGQSGIDGYNMSAQKKNEKKYVFASVFPNYAVMNLVVGEKKH